MSYQAIKDLVGYAHRTGLIEECERVWAENTLLHAMGLEAWEEPQAARERPLEDILRELLDDAAARGLIHDDVTSRDLFDTELMGRLTPRPGQVIRTFCDRYEKDPRAATDWFYDLCQNADYIRRYRIARDVKWKVATGYGELDITINLSKPEKDPKAIAAAKAAPQRGYPKCLLCRENEGYAGRIDHPARQNLRIIPVTIYEELWKDGGGARWVLWTVRAFFDGAGHVTHFQAVGTDITERQRAREALQEMKELHEGIVQSMSDGVLLTDAEGKITFLNPEFAALVGEAPEALLGGLWLDVVLPAQRAVAEEADRRRARGQADRYELVLQRRDGTCRTVLVGGSARYEPATGAYLGTLGIFTDITERQRAEAQIRRLLEEKELILKEAHHRMKNHMNTMSSLLSLQAQTLDDPKAVQALEDARGRLESMAVLYDKLYRCGAPRAMPLGNYLPELVRWVVALFPLGSLVTVETEIDEVVLSPRILSTLGILVNELVSNAMKYAFSGRSDGVLRVTASHRDGRVELTVEDDGPGFPPALDPACPSGFGLRLVALLATQLEGTLAVRSGKGAHISLDFPVE